MAASTRAMAYSAQLLTMAAVPSTSSDSLSISCAANFRRSSGIVQYCKRLATTHTNPAEARERTMRCGGIRVLSSSSSSPSSSVEGEGKLNKLEGITLYDPKGAAVSFVGLWESRPVVIAFGRHFGCILCRKRASILQSRKAEMDAAGAALVLIAPGSPEQARKFAEQTEFTGEVYADPDHASFNALEFVNGAKSTLNPKSGSRLAQAFMEGYHQDWELSFNEDTVQRGGWQQGGILVAGPGTNIVRFLFKDAEAGDEPKLEDVMAACCSN